MIKTTFLGTILTLVVSTQMFSQTVEDTLSTYVYSEPESPCKQVALYAQAVLRYENQALAYFRIDGKEQAGVQYAFLFDENRNLLQSTPINENGEFVFTGLDKKYTYSVLTQNSCNEMLEISTFSTSAPEDDTPFAASDGFGNLLASWAARKDGSTLFDLLTSESDESRQVHYFEKLAFLQHHVFRGKELPSYLLLYKEQYPEIPSESEMKSAACLCSFVVRTGRASLPVSGLSTTANLTIISV